MKIKQCPHCGSTKGYSLKETVYRYLYFDYDDEPDGSTEDYQIYGSKTKRCIDCGKKVGSVSE